MTGVQTCALPIYSRVIKDLNEFKKISDVIVANRLSNEILDVEGKEIGRASCRERV